MIDGDERQVFGEGQRLGGHHADHDAPDQTGPTGGGDGGEVAEFQAGIPHRLVNDLIDGFDVCTGGDLGDDAAVGTVGIELRQNHVGKDSPLPVDERGGGLIATGFDAEDDHGQARLKCYESMRGPYISAPLHASILVNVMSPSPLLKIGTRGSPLAMAQTHEARDTLAGAVADLAAPDALQIVEIATTGDQVQDRPLAELGGKGLFAKELDAALLDGRIDLAVHSLKDLETALPGGTVLAACLEREDPRDALLSHTAKSIDELPEGAAVGTASLRRQAQLLHRRPDIRITLLRGNIQTRMRKIADGEADATFLALAGLNRMGVAERAAGILEPEEMLPACGQGAIGITCRAGDDKVLGWLARIDHHETTTRITAERAMLDVLDGSCRTPIGGLAALFGDRQLRLRGLVARADGSQVFKADATGPMDDAEAIGREVGAVLRGRAGEELFG